ncbi:hypothetical protein AAC387_Pa03g2250 [Persea americana]
MARSQIPQIIVYKNSPVYVFQKFGQLIMRIVFRVRDSSLNTSPLIVGIIVMHTLDIHRHLLPVVYPCRVRSHDSVKQQMFLDGGVRMQF